MEMKKKNVLAEQMGRKKTTGAGKEMVHKLKHIVSVSFLCYSFGWAYIC